MCLYFSLLVGLKFRRKSGLHFSNYQSISNSFILSFTVHRSEHLDWLNLLRFYVNFNFLDAWKEIVIEPICQICLEVRVFHSTKIIESFYLDKLFTSRRFKSRWNSNYRGVDVVLVRNLIYQNFFIRNWVILDVS